MKFLKKLSVVGLVSLLSLSCFAQETGNKLFFAVDGLAPSLKFGIKKEFNERISIQGSAGFCIVGPSLLSYNFFGTYTLSEESRNLGFNLNFGLLDNYIDIIAPMYSLGMGGGAGMYYKFRNNSALTFRMGVVTGPAIDSGEYLWLTIPNFGVEYAFSLKRK